MSLDLIYDRTESDINAADDIRAKYQALKDWSGLTDAEISQLERGTLTNVTLNRVSSAVQTLAAELNAAGYAVKIVPQAFAESDTIRLTQWRQYLANVQALRDAYYTLAETGQLPDAEDRLDYAGANTIEKILADIDLLIGWMKSSYRRCGTFRAGNNAAHLPLKGSA